MNIKKKISILIAVIFTVISVVNPIAITAEAEKLGESEYQNSVINFGPYDGAQDTNHAYSPFKEEQLDLENVEYEKDALLIKIDTSLSSSAQRSPQFITNFEGIQGLEPLFPEEVTSNMKKSQAFNNSTIENLSKWYKARLKEGVDLKQAIEKFKNTPGILKVEPNYLRKIETLNLPDITTDPKMSEQWYLEQLGIKDAWDYLKSQGINPGGRRDIVVAVIDSGVDYNHPDLAANIWTNSGEIPDNGIDDDGNGYVDDYKGVCTVGNKYSGESGNPMDDNGHGTHVAGIIAASANNNEGGVGVAYNVQIMPIKAAQSSGFLSSTDIAEGIIYAMEKGADVINMSFGGYGRSTLEEDALSAAFSTSVLVAAAGNDGIPNLPHIKGKDMFPAAYPWVIGVMAENQNPDELGSYLCSFSNWDYIPKDSHEYEVMAPGAQILSTLPNGKYAKWSGTSMATPIVSGIAALVRSKYFDKDMYSSRFIMGQVVSTGISKQGFVDKLSGEIFEYNESNAISALTNTPKPSLNYVEHYIFDTKNISENNNEDGVVDSGEIIDIGLVIRNHWGKADNVIVKVDAEIREGMKDPYVTFINDTVEYGAVGNFGLDDNGLIYQNDKVTGVRNPFRLKIADNCPNDHLVPINITITAKNGFDPNDTTDYSFSIGGKIYLKVRNGQKLPVTIRSDMTLTKDKYWIVPNAVVIEQGATLRIEPGTQIQFWSSDPEDPYAEKALTYIEVRGKLIAEGTAEEPIEMFTSAFFRGYEVKIYNYNDGYSELKYCKIMNPRINVDKIDHCYFAQELFDRIYHRYLMNGEVKTTNSGVDNDFKFGFSVHPGPMVIANEISNSKFYKLGHYVSYYLEGGYLLVEGKYVKNNLFDNCYMQVDKNDSKREIGIWEYNVFLNNYRLAEQQYGDRSYWTSYGGTKRNIIKSDDFKVSFSEPIKFNENGSTYFKMEISAQENDMYRYNTNKLLLAEEFAKKIGGHVVTINDDEENSFLAQNFSDCLIGYTNYDFTKTPSMPQVKNKYYWISGEDNKYSKLTNNFNYGLYSFAMIRYDGLWEKKSEYDNKPIIIEISGTSNVTTVLLDKYSLQLGAGGAGVKLNATVLPIKANNKSIIWYSTNPSIASVNQEGYVTPLSVGNCQIVAKSQDGGIEAVCDVIVREIVDAKGIKLDKNYVKIKAGDNFKLNETVLPEDATNKNVLWSSSEPKVAKVDENGNVTGITTGRTIIRVTTEDGGYFAECIVDVVVPVEEVTLDNNFIKLLKDGQPVSLTATILPQDATIKDIIWSSSNKDIATVENGIVTPRGTGTALITATTVDGEYTASCLVAVWEKEISFKTSKVFAGLDYVFAINENDTVWGWGMNSYGQLNDGTTNNRYSPVLSKNFTDVKELRADKIYGGNNIIILKKDGTVWENGLKKNNLSNIVQISNGSTHRLALKSDGTVWAWGSNYSGQLGDGTTVYRENPIQVPNLTDVVKVVAGNNFSVALKSDGTVWAWGRNDSGQIFQESHENKLSPQKVNNIYDVKDISAQAYKTILLKRDGSVYENDYFGNVQKVNLNNITALVSGNNHTLALKSDGTVWAWGENSNGQIGDGTYNFIGSPVQVKNIKDIVYIEAGGYSSYAVDKYGKVYAWGKNNYGQLGDLTTKSSNIPVEVLFGIMPDDESPIIKSSTPSDGEMNVSLTPQIIVEFGEAVKSFDNFVYINLKDNNGNIISLKKKSIIGNQLIIEPVESLQPNTVYTLEIPEYAVVDMFNNKLEQRYIISFMTTSIMQNSATFKQQNSSTANLDAYKPAITLDELNIKWQEYVNSGEISTFKFNAILNRWWDPNVEHWMRFTSEQLDGSLYKSYLTLNYWGTTNENLIEKAIVHYNDFKNMTEVIYKPYLTQPPETCYPFVTDIYVSTEKEERATRVGAERIEVHVLFNRDMDMNVQPRVTFGPDMPTTDYRVHAINGGWKNPREWVGEFNVTPITGDGYQLFRVVGAVAADDPWLVTGDDIERFRFEIITSGTEAMNLQAEGAEGKVILSWTQDDFDLLAGYNVYRSDSYDGTYTKINSTVIPSEQKYYEDNNVIPGKTYYYKFTVVKTDLTESEFSNIAAAAAIDTVPPSIMHNPINGAAPGLPLQIYADVTDNVSVQNVYLYYRKMGTSTYSKRQMNKSTDNRYTVTIEASLVEAPGIEYYIEANDGYTTSRSGGPNNPYKVVITDAPKILSITPNIGQESGGTRVIITGTNFKEGAKVYFGGAAATNIVVESSTKITAETPKHNPQVVDVEVVNPDGYKDTMLRGFTYKIEGVEVGTVNISANKGDYIEVPIYISEVNGFTAADLTFAYDSEVLKLVDIIPGNLTSKFMIAKNTNVSGKAIVSMASTTSVTGTGTIVILQFEVLDSNKTTSPLNIESVSINSGTISTKILNGTFTLSETYRISGDVRYYSNNKEVSKVNLILNGDKTYSTTTDSLGRYTINGIEKGDYVLSALKNDETGAISAYDASLVLQYAVGLINLNDNQKIAADVDKNGKIDAMDAAHILKRSAGLIDLPFQGSGRVWVFTPDKYNYNNLNNNITYQNFTAILIGDVSGNWGGTTDTTVQNTNTPILNFGLQIVRINEEVLVPLHVDFSGIEASSMELTIAYNSNLIEVLGVEKDELTKNNLIEINNENLGILKIVIASAEKFNNVGNLLKLRIKGKNEGTVQLNVTNLQLDERSEEYSVAENRIFIKNYGNLILGDVNFDGEITVTDYLLIKNYILGKVNIELPEAIVAADINKDGKIDLTDCNIIKNLLKGE